MNVKYVMYNKQNGAIITCTQKYVAEWVKRGFEVQELQVSVVQVVEISA